MQFSFGPRVRRAVAVTTAASLLVVGPLAATPAAGRAAFDVAGQQAPRVAPVSNATANENLAIAAGDGEGYWQVAADGGVFAFGDAQFAGSGVGLVSAPVVGMAVTATGGGYWLATENGGVFAFGDAPFAGSLGGVNLNSPITGIATSEGGDGYYLVGADGGVFAFGDAVFRGSAANLGFGMTEESENLILGIAVDPEGGYYLNGIDGGVFAYGAPFLGSAAGYDPEYPTMGVTVDADGEGYWQVGLDGAVFAHAGTGFYGNATGVASLDTGEFPPLAIAMASSGTGEGYWITDLSGGLTNYGDADLHGSVGEVVDELAMPIIDIERSGPA